MKTANFMEKLIDIVNSDYICEHIKGGLSEGFVRAGYMPLAHIEMNGYACDTLRTRAAFKQI